MLIVHIHVWVKPEFVESFKQATIENARKSLQEPGIARFDVIQRSDDPTRFVLYEAYRTPGDFAAHQQTPHYLKWKDTVKDWMAEPRKGEKHVSVFPGGESGW